MLKFTGITRKIDVLGRVCVPKELRKTLGFANGQEVDIQVSGSRIIIQKKSQNGAGVVRSIDGLGRIVFPVEARRKLRVDVGDPMEIMVDTDRIVFQKYQPGCLFCGSVNGLKYIVEKPICSSCVGEIREGA